MKLNTPKIDSLRLLIPFDDVEVNKEHSTFLRHTAEINSDGEVLNQKFNTTYRLHSNPCSSHYQVANIIDNGIVSKVLKLGFSAKTLKVNYFDGITKENVSNIYDFIISENVVKISKETLLKAKVVDVDICFDLLLNETNVVQAITIASQLTKPSKLTNGNAFRQKNNVGIEWSNRNKVGKSYKKKQYLKYYAKSLELKHNSTIFYDAYIKNTEVDKVLNDNKSLRVETTIKNKAHWETYNANIDTLNDLLNLDLNNYLEVFNRPINHYMQGITAIETRTDLTPNQKLQIDYVALLKEYKDLNENDCIDYMVNKFGGDNRQKRYQYKKTLAKLLSESRVLDIKKHDANQLDMVTELEKMKLIPKG